VQPLFAGGETDLIIRIEVHVFDIGSSGVWTFNAVASTALQGTGLQVTLNDQGVKYAGDRW
jgi:hypothetical protein